MKQNIAFTFICGLIFEIIIKYNFRNWNFIRFVKKNYGKIDIFSKLNSNSQLTYSKCQQKETTRQSEDAIPQITIARMFSQFEQRICKSFWRVLNAE